MTEVEYLRYGFESVKVDHTGSGGPVEVIPGPVLLGAVKTDGGSVTIFDDTRQVWPAVTTEVTFTDTPLRIHGSLQVDSTAAATIFVAYKVVP
jgi:hypothetical protein